eukprot:2145673-Prymnesium_polylepis.1
MLGRPSPSGPRACRHDAPCGRGCWRAPRPPANVARNRTRYGGAARRWLMRLNYAPHTSPEHRTGGYQRRWAPSSASGS